jgi:hypothetical protein
VQLIDDDEAERAEQIARIGVGQHQRDLLGRGEQKVGRRDALPLAPRWRRVTGPRLEVNGQAHLGNRLGEVAGDIDGKGL